MAGQFNEFTWKLGLLTCVAGLGGFLFGYDTGIVSGAMIFIAQQFNLSSFWHELIVSITIGFAALFSLVGGLLADAFGRRIVIALAAGIFSIGSCLLGLANSAATLLIGRAIVGIGIGLVSMSTPMYLAECAPAALRGTMVTYFNFSIIFGQLIAYLVALAFSHLEHVGWRYMLGLGAVPAIIQIVGLSFLPETPRYLLTKNNVLEAESVLRELRPPNSDVVEEARALQFSLQKNQDTKGFCVILNEIWSHEGVKRALIVGCLTQAFQQLVGINTVMYYSASIVQMAGVKSKTEAVLYSALISLAFTLVSTIAFFFIDSFGRRFLLITSNVGVLIGLLMLSGSFLVIAMDTTHIDSQEAAAQNNSCSTHKTCSSCISQEKCGMCFSWSGHGKGSLVSNTSCLPAQKEHGSYRYSDSSEVGRCEDSDESHSDYEYASNYCPSKYAWLVVVSMLVYLLSFGPGYGCIPWVLNSEIYPQWARSTANSLSTATNWTFNLIVSLTFLTLTELITKTGAFAFYATFALASLIFYIKFLPETKGVPLENVEYLFMKNPPQHKIVSINNYSELHSEFEEDSFN